MLVWLIATAVTSAVVGLAIALKPVIALSIILNFVGTVLPKLPPEVQELALAIIMAFLSSSLAKSNDSAAARALEAMVSVRREKADDSAPDKPEPPPPK